MRAEITHHRHRRLLRSRHERPRRRAAQQRDELASFHCPMPPVLPTERIAHLSAAGVAALREFDPAYDRSGSWLRKNVSERSKATFDWLASTLRRADWLFLRLRGLETLLKLPEVILSTWKRQDSPQFKPGSPPGAASR